MADPDVFSRLAVGQGALRPYQAEVTRAIARSIKTAAGATFSVMMARQMGKNELSATARSVSAGAVRGTWRADSESRADLPAAAGDQHPETRDRADDQPIDHGAAGKPSKGTG